MTVLRGAAKLRRLAALGNALIERLVELFGYAHWCQRPDRTPRCEERVVVPQRSIDEALGRVVIGFVRGVIEYCYCLSFGYDVTVWIAHSFVFACASRLRAALLSP